MVYYTQDIDKLSQKYDVQVQHCKGKHRYVLRLWRTNVIAFEVSWQLFTFAWYTGINSP